MKGELIRQLTDGKWDVANVAGVDEQNRRVYFTAGFSSPMNRKCFRFHWTGQSSATF